MGGTRYITQKALHGMSAQRTVSIQEAVHMVDSQDLVICSENSHISACVKVRYLLVKKMDRKGKMLSPCIKTVAKTLPISHWTSISTATFTGRCSKKKDDRNDLTKHRTLLSVGQNCKP